MKTRQTVSYIFNLVDVFSAAIKHLVCVCVYTHIIHYFIRLSGHISYHNSIMFCGVKQLCIAHSVLCFYTLWEKHYGIKSEHCKTCSQWIIQCWCCHTEFWLSNLPLSVLSALWSILKLPLWCYFLFLVPHSLDRGRLLRTMKSITDQTSALWSQMSCILKADFSTCNRELKLEFKLHSDDSFLGISQLAYPCVFTRHWQTAANQAF